MFVTINPKYLRWVSVNLEGLFCQSQRQSHDTDSGGPDDMCPKCSGYSLLLYILGFRRHQSVCVKCQVGNYVRQTCLPVLNKIAEKIKELHTTRARWLTPVIPALWAAEAGESLEAKSLRPAWPTWWNAISTKNTKISQAWWSLAVVSATWEAEAGESLEPRRQKLQWAEISPLHASLGNRARFWQSLKNQETTDAKKNMKK